MTENDNYLFYNSLNIKECLMKIKRMKQRVVWGFNPITRVMSSRKNYKRTNSKAILRCELKLT